VADVEYTECTVGYRRRDGQDSVEVGAIVDGAFFAFASFKEGGWDSDVHEAQQAAAAQQTVDAQAAPAQAEPVEPAPAAEPAAPQA
jgi:hypothetical protein